MAHLIDSFVDHEISQNLKLIGFDGGCMAHWVLEGKNWNIYPHFQNLDGCCNSDGFLAASTWDQAFDWFREEHGFLHIISPSKNIENTFSLEVFNQNGFFFGSGGYSYFEAKVKCLKTMIQYSGKTLVAHDDH